MAWPGDSLTQSTAKATPISTTPSARTDRSCRIASGRLRLRGSLWRLDRECIERHDLESFVVFTPAATVELDVDVV